MEDKSWRERVAAISFLAIATLILAMLAESIMSALFDYVMRIL